MRMGSALLVLLLATALATCRSPFSADRGETDAAPERPNILIILTDDQGYADVGAYGATDLETPHLDWLASRGVRFTQFYAGAPLCSPSRASLLTGKTPERAGVPSNVSSRVTIDGMPSEQVTIAERLKEAGYRTGLVGKWHLGASPATTPGNQGFDFSFGHINGCIDNYSHTMYWEEPYTHDLQLNGQQIYRQGQYFPDLMVQEAERFISAPSDQPFFLYFAINMPHYPYQGDPRWLAHYKNRGMANPRLEYAAFISTMDEKIGRVLKALEKSGELDNTIIIFQSDHGFSTESRANFGGGSAGNLRGAKFSLFEGGLRVPAMISWPGRIPAPAARMQLAVSADWFPTILDLADISADGLEFDGKSLVPVLMDGAAPTPHDHYIWKWDPARAVRKGDWKLIYNTFDTSPLPGQSQSVAVPGPYLVNIAADETESQNLAEAHPDIVRELSALLEASEPNR